MRCSWIETWGNCFNETTLVMIVIAQLNLSILLRENNIFFSSNSKWQHRRSSRKFYDLSKTIRACLLGRFVINCYRNAFVIQTQYHRWAQWIAFYETAAYGLTTCITVNIPKNVKFYRTLANKGVPTWANKLELRRKLSNNNKWLYRILELSILFLLFKQNKHFKNQTQKTLHHRHTSHQPNHQHQFMRIFQHLPDIIHALHRFPVHRPTAVR